MVDRELKERIKERIEEGSKNAEISDISIFLEFFHSFIKKNKKLRQKLKDSSFILQILLIDINPWIMGDGELEEKIFGINSFHFNNALKVESN